MDKINEVIAQAKAEIEALGWSCSVEHGEGKNAELIHLVITKGAQRFGWGLFQPLYCWTEAYERVTGCPWQILIPQQ